MSESTEELILTDADYRTAAGRLFDFKKSEGFVPVGLHLYRQSDGSILYGRVRMHKPDASGGHENSFALSGMTARAGSMASRNRTAGSCCTDCTT